MSADVFNECGGSIYRLANGNYLAAFTANSAVSDDDANDRNASKVRTTYAWEIDFDTDEKAPEVQAELIIPIPHDVAGKQDAYRFTPWGSVAGESTTSPFSSYS